MEGKLPIRSRKDPKTMLLKLGFALLLSVAGYFASNFRFRPRPPPPDGGSKKNGAKSTRVHAGGLRDELRVLSSEEELAKIVNGTSNVCTNSVEEELVKIVNGTSNSCTTNTATAKMIEEEGEEFVIEEFAACPESKAMNYEWEKEKLEFETYPESKPMQAMNDEWEKEKLELEQEIGYLRNLVEALKERERTLEVQLLEYYGLKEQEATLRELENRVKVNATESKLLYMRIDSLQADNQKLQAQVSDYPRAVAELESAREEIKVLRGKLKLEGGETKEKLASLHQRIRKLQERILKDGETDTQVEKKLTRVKELEDEIMDLQTVNSRLAEENLKLVQQLESTKMAASSNLEDREVEADHLREENETLKEEIEQLQTDRCTDVEELVYLRWVNACLRYELRNYQPPPPGKTVAKDLGRSLSPRSEQKAKQLILEYAHHDSEINVRNIMSLFNFDADSCSSSSSSSSSSCEEECMDTSTDVSSSVENATPNHLGMDSHANEQWLNNNAQSQTVSMLSLDVERIRRLDVVGVGKDNMAERCKIDIGTSGGHMRMISEEDDCSSGSFQNQDQDDSDAPEKVQLKKLAQVFKGSRGGSHKAKRGDRHRLVTTDA